LGVPLAASALLESRGMIRDDLSHQRDALNFVQEAFPESARGFAGHSEFVCRHDSDPFPTRFVFSIRTDFYGEGAEARTDEFLSEFRSRPVSFMLLPADAVHYPERVRRFWEEHYVRLYRQIEVPGRLVQGPQGTRVAFDPMVGGRYRWWPDEAGTGLMVGDTFVEAGDTVTLRSAEVVSLRIPDGGSGRIALDVGRPPQPDPEPFFTPFLQRLDRPRF
jgi:hypothetical protein